MPPRTYESSTEYTEDGKVTTTVTVETAEDGDVLTVMEHHITNLRDFNGTVQPTKPENASADWWRLTPDIGQHSTMNPRLFADAHFAGRCIPRSAAQRTLPYSTLTYARSAFNRNLAYY